MRNKTVSGIFEWAEMFAVSVCIVLAVMTLVLRHSPVSGHSMYPTLHGNAAYAGDEFAAEQGKNDVLLVSNFFYTPKSGDIVVTQRKNDMQDPLVKRVIAVGGQSIRIDFENWQVYVDGQPLSEDYVNREEGDMHALDFDAVMSGCAVSADGGYIVPEGYIFCMGDNRNHSSDSRAYMIGLIDKRFVVGHVIGRIWPFDRFGAVK